MSFKKMVLVILWIVAATNTVNAKISYCNPLDYGISRAATGIERYQVLVNCHKDAIRKNLPVSYKGIDSLFIEIPSNATSIPLSEYTDFSNCVITVLNSNKRIHLYSIINESFATTISKEDICLERCPSNMNNGKFLLLLSDKTPWVTNRKGFGYGAYRSDIIILKDGKYQNKPVTSYSSEETIVDVKYIPVDYKKVIVKNLNFNRNDYDYGMTSLFRFNGICDLRIQNIVVNTNEDSPLFGESCIFITNSAGVTLNNIDINGTYSKIDQYGYGIYLDNVYDVKLNKVIANAKWGVMGGYNVNSFSVYNSSLNRIDLHCYGRDYYCYNCEFDGLPLPFGSLYGSLVFEKCTFTNCQPVHLRQDFNMNTPFDVYWRRCTFNLDEDHNCLLYVNGLSAVESSRSEVKEKSLPNIFIKRCSVNLSSTLDEWIVINAGDIKYQNTIKNIEEIKITRTKINGKASLNICTVDLPTEKPLKIKVPKGS